MRREFLLFIMYITVLLGGSFFIHTGLLDYLGYDKYDNHILLGYVSNLVLTCVIYLLLMLLKKRYHDQLGFLFLVGTMLKFLMYFALFAPIFKADGVVERLEWTGFFGPYILCLLLETIMVIKLVNKTN